MWNLETEKYYQFNHMSFNLGGNATITTTRLSELNGYSTFSALFDVSVLHSNSRWSEIFQVFIQQVVVLLFKALHNRIDSNFHDITY